MDTKYLVEVDYEWREVSTKTEKHEFSSLDSVKQYIEQAKKYGKYEGYRLYKTETTLVESE